MATAKSDDEKKIVRIAFSHLSCRSPDATTINTYVSNYVFQVKENVRKLVKNRIRSACTNDTLLHLCVSRLNVIKSGYFNDGTAVSVSIHCILYSPVIGLGRSIHHNAKCLIRFLMLQGIFPNYRVVKLLLDCHANVNAKNESKSTPLHIASNPYNYVGDVRISDCRLPTDVPHSEMMK